jgi:hypothetical protein
MAVFGGIALGSGTWGLLAERFSISEALWTCIEKVENSV